MKLLCILGDLNVGGAETFIMKVFRNIDKSKYSIDFLVFSDMEYPYNREVRELGGKIFVATAKEDNPLKCFRDIYKIVKTNRYKNVLKVSEYSIGAIDLLAAGLGGARIRAFRSTNAGSLESNKRVFLHKLLIPFANIVSNVLIAPSSEAAIFTFGRKAVLNGKVNYLNNGIPLYKFIENDAAKKKIKEEYNLNGKFVIGHIGRFSEQKNHRFLIKVFEEYHKYNKDSILILVGIGELFNEINKLIVERNLSDCVKLFGLRNDIPDVLSVFNVLLLPSYYEGMPNVVIEAQAMGVPCIVSNTITKEANVTGAVKYAAIEDSIDTWMTLISNSRKMDIEKSHELLKENGYDLKDVINKFIILMYGVYNEN
jgi:glycosyltransferase involved in cell wall biosynthesis